MISKKQVQLPLAVMLVSFAVSPLSLAAGPLPSAAITRDATTAIETFLGRVRPVAESIARKTSDRLTVRSELVCSNGGTPCLTPIVYRTGGASQAIRGVSTSKPQFTKILSEGQSPQLTIHEDYAAIGHRITQIPVPKELVGPNTSVSFVRSRDEVMLARLNSGPVGNKGVQQNFKVEPVEDTWNGGIQEDVSFRTDGPAQFPQSVSISNGRGGRIQVRNDGLLEAYSDSKINLRLIAVDQSTGKRTYDLAVLRPAYVNPEKGLVRIQFEIVEPDQLRSVETLGSLNSSSKDLRDQAEVIVIRTNTGRESILVPEQEFERNLGRARNFDLSDPNSLAPHPSYVTPLNLRNSLQPAAAVRSELKISDSFNGSFRADAHSAAIREEMVRSFDNRASYMMPRLGRPTPASNSNGR